MAAATAVRAAGTVVRGAKADPAVVVRVVPVAGPGASASIFARRRFASSAWRMTGVCARHQRWLGVAIKRARNIALLPFAGSAAGTQAPRVVVPGAAHAAPAHGTLTPAPVTPVPAAEAPKA